MLIPRSMFPTITVNWGVNCLRMQKWKHKLLFKIQDKACLINDKKKKKQLFIHRSLNLLMFINIAAILTYRIKEKVGFNTKKCEIQICPSNKSVITPKKYYEQLKAKFHGHVILHCHVLSCSVWRDLTSKSLILQRSKLSTPSRQDLGIIPFVFIRPLRLCVKICFVVRKGGKVLYVICKQGDIWWLDEFVVRKLGCLGWVLSMICHETFEDLYRNYTVIWSVSNCKNVCALWVLSSLQWSY